MNLLLNKTCNIRHEIREYSKEYWEGERKELKYLDELTVKQNLQNKTLKEIGRAERKERQYLDELDPVGSIVRYEMMKLCTW